MAEWVNEVINYEFDNGGCEIYPKIPTFTTQYHPTGGCGVAKMAIILKRGCRFVIEGFVKI